MSTHFQYQRSLRPIALTVVSSKMSAGAVVRIMAPQAALLYGEAAGRIRRRQQGCRRLSSGLLPSLSRPAPLARPRTII